MAGHSNHHHIHLIGRILLFSHHHSLLVHIWIIFLTLFLGYFCLYEILLYHEREEQGREEYVRLSLENEAAEEDGERAVNNTPQDGQGSPDDQALLAQRNEDVQTAAQEEKWRKEGFLEEEIRLLCINQDYAGILEIPVLELRYPVAASHDNEEYLSRTFEGNDNEVGCIFLDCGCSKDYSDQHTFLFGHNRRDGSMFGSLRRFTQDTSLVGENPYLYLTYRGTKSTWQIFAYGIIPRDNKDMYSYLLEDDDYDNWLETVRTTSWYYNTIVNSSVQAALADRAPIITLSTCWGSGHTHNLVVHAVKEENPEECGFE